MQAGKASATRATWLSVPSELGDFGLVASERGLLGVVLPARGEPPPAVAALVHRRYPAARRGTTALLARFALSLQLYLAGEGSGFDGPLDWDDASPFDQVVWETTRSIPHGETRTYGWVARAAGDPHAVRAIGAALGRNPLPVVVPCHRVLASGGALGGFSAGLAMKRALLRLEGLDTGGEQTQLPLV